MKKILFLIAFLSVSSQSFAFEVVELPLANSNKIVIKMMFRNGSVSDPAGKEGLTALTAALVMDGGTGEMSSSQIKEMSYPWAASWWATSDKEVVTFTFEFHKDHSDKILPILIGLITQPKFDESDFRRVISNQQNFVNQVIRASSDEDFSKLGLEEMMFRGTRYQHMVRGTTSGLESITVDDVIKHYTSVFTKDRVTLGIAGNYAPDYLNVLREVLAQLPESSMPISDRVEAIAPEGIQVGVISKKQALGSAIFAGMPLPVTRSDQSFAALMVANSWLGEHRKSYSRLYQKIREQRSMNYGDYSYIEWYEAGGSNMLPLPGFPRSSNYFSIWIRPVQTAEALRAQYPELKDIRIGHAHFALRMAIRELDLIIQNGMSEEDFKLTRDFLRSYMKLYIQTPGKQLGFLMDSRFYDRKDYIVEMDELLSGLKLEDVNAAIKKYWQTNSMFVCIVTDDSEAEPLKVSLLENMPSPMTYSDALKATLPAAILAEDDEVATFPLNITKVDIRDASDVFRN